MRKLAHLGFVLAILLVPVTTAAQGFNGGILYADDFFNWNLPQGTGPANGSIAWQDPTICKVSSAGFNFVGPKVGRPLLLIDVNPAMSEIIVPTQVLIGPGGCSLNASMAHQHYTYNLRSGTAGLQEAIDYDLSQWFGSLVIATRQWTSVGGLDGMLTAATGSTSVPVIDERTNCPVPYTWSGSAYVAGPSWCGGGGGGTGTVTDFSSGNLPPLFVTNVTNPTTTPALTFSLSNAPDLDFFGNVSGSTGQPGYVHFIAGSNVTLTEGVGTLTFSATGGGGGTGCTIGGIADTDVLSVHPLGTCYGSSTFTWDDASGNRNLVIGDSTSTTNTQETYQIGFGNTVSASSISTGSEDFDIYVMGSDNGVSDTTGVGDQIQTVNILGTQNELSVTATSGFGINNVGIMGQGNTITASNSLFSIFGTYITGEFNSVEDILNSVDDVEIVGNNNDVNGASSTLQILGHLNQAINVSLDNPLDVNQVIAGSQNLAKNTGGGTYSDYFEVFGHEIYEHDCFDCIAVGSGVEEATNHEMGVGMSRIPELRFSPSNVQRTPLTIGLPAPINTAQGITRLPGGITQGATCTVTFTGGTGSGGTGQIYVSGSISAITHYSIQITVGGSYSVAPTGGTLSGGSGCSGSITVQANLAVVQACTSGREGSFASITDSTTNALGTTITGGGSNHVSGYCNGTNWIVAAGGTGASSPLTTKGDLYTFSTLNTRLPVGTDGQVLSANSAQATGLLWVAASPLNSKGDVYVWGSTNSRLPAGANGQVLSSDSTQTLGLKWINAFTNPATNLGDTYYYSGSAVAALAGSISASTLCLTQTGTGSISAAPIWGSCAGSAATALSSVTAATGANTAASGNNPITWNWAQTTNSQTAFTFGETSAAIGTGNHELDVTTLAGSTAIPLSINQSLNSAQTIPALQILPTWNTSGVVDAALLVNVTNTASGAASKLLDLQVGGTSKLAVDKAGLITNATWNGVAIANAFLANSSTTVNGQTCTLGSTCTISIGSGTVTSFVASSGSWPSFLIPSVATATTTPTLSVSLANQSIHTFLSGPSSGSSTTPTFRTIVAADIPTLNQSTTGNAATASSLAGTPTLCSSGQAPTGILPNGNATGCALLGSGTLSGQTAGWAVEAASATTATSPFPMDDAITTGGFVTIHKNVQVLGTGYSAVGPAPNLFSALPTCSTSEGQIAPVTDSTTNTWGATITGGGSFHALAYCDGSNWTVAAK